jgi:hypothetical protein
MIEEASDEDRRATVHGAMTAVMMVARIADGLPRGMARLETMIGDRLRTTLAVLLRPWAFL